MFIIFPWLFKSTPTYHSWNIYPLVFIEVSGYTIFFRKQKGKKQKLPPMFGPKKTTQNFYWPVRGFDYNKKSPTPWDLLRYEVGATNFNLYLFLIYLKTIFL